MHDRDALKRAAAEAAVELVEDGMVVGLGTGSTAAFAVEALAVRHRQGLRFIGIPTSRAYGSAGEGRGHSAHDVRRASARSISRSTAPTRSSAAR